MDQTRKVISETDIAVLVIEAGNSLSASEQKLIDQLSSRSVPCIMVETKADLMTESKALQEALSVSSKTGAGIEELKQKLGAMLPEKKKKSLLEDLVSPGDLVLLVIPVDASAPKGRLILPQQQTMREILDLHASFISCQTEDLPNTLAMLKDKPSLVITDSQAFGAVSRLVPEDIPLTSFSILFARYKGDLALLVQGAAALSSVTDESRVLISEGCTHHRQCNDIGTVKLPGWIEKHSGSRPQFFFTSGREFPDDISGYDLIVHCGGCMLNEKEMRSRLQQAKEAGIPIVNYGTAIACMHGLLERSLRPFRKEHALLKP
jgi:[FeFe] hydrogenase H-cluster maturation GTPase HydF